VLTIIMTAIIKIDIFIPYCY